MGSDGGLPPIDSLFRAHVAYDVDGEGATERISTKARALADRYGVELDNWRGGPSWSAYVIAEAADRAQLERFVRGLCGYIRRFKGGSVLL